MGEPAAEITALLGRVSDGDRHARDALLPLVYHELEAIARGYVHSQRSIEPRELVHQLYVRLARAWLTRQLGEGRDAAECANERGAAGAWNRDDRARDPRTADRAVR